MTESFPLINLYQSTFSSNQQVKHNRSINFPAQLFEAHKNHFSMNLEAYGLFSIHIMLVCSLVRKLIERLCCIGQEYKWEVDENEYRRFSDGTYLFPSFQILILVLKLIIVYFNN